MTDLILSEESKQYQDLARDFFQNEVAAKSEKLDHEAVFPADLYKAAWELGLATTLVPEACGGLGLSLWDSVVMAEEAGAASGGLAAAFEGNILALAPVLLSGNESQKQQFLTLLTESPALASFCFAGTADGSSFPMSAAVYKNNAAEFVLNGKSLIAVNGRSASWFLLLARDEDNGKNTAFVFPSDLPGIIRGEDVYKLGRKCADICYLTLADLVLDKSAILGDCGAGDAVVLESSCISAAITAAHATGLMRCALENSIRYSKERQTFGKPLAKHQALSFMMADMAKNTECARLMSWKAGSLFDAGIREPFAALAARTFAVDAAMAVATDAVQIYGGYGYSKEYPVERLMRDAKMMQMMAGTSTELKSRIAQDELAAV